MYRIGPEITACRIGRYPVLPQHRLGFYLDLLLRNIPPRLPGNCICQPLPFLMGQPVSIQRALTSVAGYVLKNQAVHMRENKVPLLRIPGQICGHIGQDRFLIQIISNHGRDKVVQAPILCQRAARSIDNGNVSRRIGFHQMRNAAGRILVKAKGIQHTVQRQPVDNGNPLKTAFGRTVIYLIIHNDQPFRLRHHSTGELCHISQLKMRQRIFSFAEQHYNTAFQLRVIVYNIPVQLTEQNIQSTVITEARHLIILRCDLPA